MSEYVTQRVGAATREGIVEALIDLGFPREVIEVHEVAVPLVGYQGDQRSTRAHVIVRRAAVASHMSVGAPNDAGWERRADGTWRAHVSAYDQQWWSRGDVGGGQTREQRFAQSIALGEIVAQARRQGVRVSMTTTTDPQGRRVVRLRASDPLETGARTAARTVAIR
jgi:hypothetical protein